jgi:hypothetical protein
MCMIGHNDCGEELVLTAVVSDTALENDLPRRGRQMLATDGGKRNEQCALIFLEVRESSPVAVFRFHEH